MRTTEGLTPKQREKLAFLLLGFVEVDVFMKPDGEVAQLLDRAVSALDELEAVESEAKGLKP